MNPATFMLLLSLLGLTGCALEIKEPDAQPSQTCPTGECPYPTVTAAEVPTVNLPLEARQKNWGGGSCVHASTVMCLRWQGLDEMADLWRKTYSGGEGSSGLNSKLEKNGLRYAYTTSGDVAFLEWACRTRRGSGITYGGNHYQLLVHLDNERAGILDNNAIHKINWVPREQFIRAWKGYGGWACTVVYSPAPPMPHL